MEAITRKDPMTTTLTPGGAMTEQTAPQPRTLADLRRAAGMSRKQVGERMGVNWQRVGQIEARYPNVNYTTLTRYIEAVGGSVQLVVGSTRIRADQLVTDPSLAGTRKHLDSRNAMGKLVRDGEELIYVPPSATEKLPLQGNHADTGGDDTGGQVDHADTESDQGDSGQRQQP